MIPTPSSSQIEARALSEAEAAVSDARLRSAATSSTTRLRCVWRNGMTTSL